MFMLVPIIIMSLGFLLLCWFLFEKCKAYSLKATFIKATTSLLFIASAAYCFSKTGLKVFPMFAIVGLAAGMLGDVFLELKCVFPEKDFEYTLSGFVAFGVGHIFYVTGLFLEFYKGQNVLYIIIPLALAILMGPVVLLMEKLCKLNYGKFKWVCFSYGMLLFSLTFSTFSVWMMNGFNNTGLLLLFIAGVLFALSDLVLNPTYFGKGHEKPVDFIVNGVIYYAAQYLIALSILFI